MAYYMLATHTVEDEPREPMSEERMQELMTKMQALEAEMKSTGAWVFSGRLHEPDTATVLRPSGEGTLTTDGPFVESKEHLAGFYIISAEDLDAALALASKVTEVVRRPIEVWPFRDAATS